MLVVLSIDDDDHVDGGSDVSCSGLCAGLC